jgi:hypothetical protein
LHQLHSHRLLLHELDRLVTHQGDMKVRVLHSLQCYQLRLQVIVN